MAAEVAKGRWEPTCARLGSAHIESKERLLHKFDPLDQVVHGVVADALSAQLGETLSPSVWSYQRGRSALACLRTVAAYLRRHRRAVPDPRNRGLYLLRRDVSAFGDSVRLDGAAPLWAQLRAIFGDPAMSANAARAIALIERVVRPPVLSADGAPCHRLMGLPTGSPVNPVFTNLYLQPLDAALDSIQGACYARYGDDLIFAHPDAAVVRDASARLDGVLAQLHLRVNASKRRDLWFNGAGRPSAETDFQSARQVHFLGGSISFHGALGLPPEKVSALLHELRERLRRTALLAWQSLPTALGADERLRLLCGVTAEGLDPASPFALPYAAELRTLVDDRGQLRDLRLRVVSLLIEMAVGQHSVRALRQYSPARIHALGLPDLLGRRSQRKIE